MCGIVGFKTQSFQINRESFDRMVDVLAHRGPDGRGTFYSSNDGVALGHRRLAIIDLSDAASQPMTNEDRSIWLTCNGEIYNFKAIGKELLAKGHRFVSNCDSEVVLHAYEEWGTECVQRFRGMFAFCIWDSRKNKMFMARDRFGIKPFYYYYKDHNFVFASELKAIIESGQIPRSINQEALIAYFLFGCIPSPMSIWENVHKLPPAHYAVLDDTGLQVKQYWSCTTDDEKPLEHELVKDVHDLLSESVEMRNISDVETGLFLSGGLDSSTIAYVLQKVGIKIKAFSVGFSHRGKNELPYARKVAQKCGIPIHEQLVSEDSFNLLNQLSWFYDEPFGDSSMIPTYLISRFAGKDHGLKVILAGDGGDEVFGGYNWYLGGLQALEHHEGTNPGDSVRDYYSATTFPFFLGSQFLDGFKKDLRSYVMDWRKRYFSDFSPVGIKGFQLLDSRLYLPEDILVKVDRASMANSLEVRVPFLDHLLAEKMFKISSSIYFKNSTLKYILKKMLTGFYDDEIIHRPKKGFSIPLDSFLKTVNFREVILDSRLWSSLVLERPVVEEILNGKLENVDVPRAFALYNLCLWEERWLN